MQSFQLVVISIRLEDASLDHLESIPHFMSIQASQGTLPLMHGVSSCKLARAGKANHLCVLYTV